MLYNILCFRTFYNLFYVMRLCNMWLWYLWHLVTYMTFMHNIISHSLSKSKIKKRKLKIKEKKKQKREVKNKWNQVYCSQLWQYRNKSSLLSELVNNNYDCQDWRQRTLYYFHFLSPFLFKLPFFLFLEP